MTRPRLLDLFCGAGGAAMGYQLAGFHVTGIDTNPQPRYAGDEFHQADAVTFPLDGFDAVHASPPCQDHTNLPTTNRPHGTGWMLTATVERLKAQPRPWAVENVPGAAPLMPGAYMLCGKSFGLAPLKRHRLFLTSVPMLVPPCSCNQRDHVVGVYGDLRRADRASGGRRRPGQSLRAGVETARRLLGCPWMDGPELSQAIPPAYTEFIGEQLMAALPARCAQCSAELDPGRYHDCGHQLALLEVS